MITYYLCNKTIVPVAAVLVLFAALLPTRAQADATCRLLSDAQYLELTQKSDAALTALQGLVDDELILAVVTVAPALRDRSHTLADASFHFRDEIRPAQIFGGYTAELLAPSEHTLNIEVSHRDRDATQAAYRARREALALLAALPIGARLGAPVASASTAVRRAIVDFIRVSTPFISNDNCRHDLEVSRRDERNRKRTEAASGQKPTGCDAPIPFALPEGCAELARAALGSSAICIDHDAGGACSAELPKPAAPVPVNRDLAAAGGICPDQPAYAAGRAGGRPGEVAVQIGIPGVGGAGGAVTR